MIDFKNKKIIITGASGGIGRSLVEKFVNLNGNVLATGTKIEKLENLKNDFPSINILKFDISEQSKIEEFIENANDKLSGLDVLINNAGINFDNLSLKMVRDISCCYYEYKDKDRAYGKTIGFIAQQVNSILPMAVTKHSEFIPNEMRVLDDISWEFDNSNNKFKLFTDIQDVSGEKYKFYVINDINDNKTLKQKEVIGNSDNTFTFDSSWNYIFCYGKEVDNFHSIDKQKLFALNFSATQEIDKIQQAEKAKLEAAETKLTVAETEITTLKTQLAAVLARLDALESA